MTGCCKTSPSDLSGAHAAWYNVHAVGIQLPSPLDHFRMGCKLRWNMFYVLVLFWLYTRSIFRGQYDTHESFTYRVSTSRTTVPVPPLCFLAASFGLGDIVRSHRTYQVCPIPENIDNVCDCIKEHSSWHTLLVALRRQSHCAWIDDTVCWLWNYASATSLKHWWTV